MSIWMLTVHTPLAIFYYKEFLNIQKSWKKCTVKQLQEESTTGGIVFSSVKNLIFDQQFHLDIVDTQRWSQNHLKIGINQFTHQYLLVYFSWQSMTESILHSGPCEQCWFIYVLWHPEGGGSGGHELSLFIYEIRVSNSFSIPQN